MPEAELKLWQQSVSSSLGAVVTALAVTPLDLAKTRLQVQAATWEGQAISPCQPGSREWIARVCKFPECQWTGRFQACLCAYHNVSPQLKGTFDAMHKIATIEGKTALWNGLRATLVLQIPSTVIYLGVYEHLRDRLRARLRRERQWLAPTLAGMTARSVAATLVAPLELVRTRRMAATQWNHATVWGSLKAIVKEEGGASLLRGIGPTLLRDVPFSGMYWYGIESISARIRADFPDKELNSSAKVYREWVIGLVAGCVSGGAAALVTTPFDVLKTRQQVAHIPKPGLQLSEAAREACFPCNRLSLVRVARNMWRTEGAKSFFVGGVARVSKVGPSCAIMYSTFMMMKAAFAEAN